MSTAARMLGPFPLKGVLGEGGSAVVYATVYQGQEAALKVPRLDPPLTEREQGQFLDEAARMARVAHPSLVPLLDSGRLPDGTPYLCMPRLRGQTLAERLTRGPLPVETALRLFAGLASAVEALHQQKLVHRDIKPENAFVDEHDERAILLDLGIARDESDTPTTTTREGRVRGTPAYMAPERFFGASASRSSDVYELAVVLYVMLIGQLPWDDAFDAAGRLAPLSPAERGVTLPGALSVILLEALATRPEARPPSAAALAARVEQAVLSAAPGRITEDLPIPQAAAPAPTLPSVEPEPLPPRKSRVMPALLALLAVTAAGLGVRVMTQAPEPAAPAALAPPVPPSASERIAATTAPEPPATASQVNVPQASVSTSRAVTAGTASVSRSPSSAQRTESSPPEPPAAPIGSPGWMEAVKATMDTMPGDEEAYMKIPECRALMAVYCRPELITRQGGFHASSCKGIERTIRDFARPPGTPRQGAIVSCRNNIPHARKRYEELLGKPYPG